MKKIPHMFFLSLMLPSLAFAGEAYHHNIGVLPPAGSVNGAVYIDESNITALQAMPAEKRQRVLDRWAAGQGNLPRAPVEYRQEILPDHPTTEEAVTAAQERKIYRPPPRVYAHSLPQDDVFGTSLVDPNQVRVKNPDRNVRLNAFDRALRSTYHDRTYTGVVQPVLRSFEPSDRRVLVDRYRPLASRAGRQNQFTEAVEHPRVVIVKPPEGQELDQNRLDRERGYIPRGIKSPTDARIKSFEVPITTQNIRYGERSYRGERHITAFRDDIAERVDVTHLNRPLIQPRHYTPPAEELPVQPRREYQSYNWGSNTGRYAVFYGGKPQYGQENLDRRTHQTVETPSVGVRSLGY